MFNIEADLLAGCWDFLNDAILFTCNQLIDGFFFISGLGMFNYWPKLNGAACPIDTLTIRGRIVTSMMQLSQVFPKLLDSWIDELETWRNRSINAMENGWTWAVNAL